MSVMLFIVWPELDIHIASVFYDPQTKEFIGQGVLLLRVTYIVFAYLHIPILIVLLACIVFFHIRRKSKCRICTIYLLCCLLAGPGILVNLFLKDNGTGRARPFQVSVFGGEGKFTEPFVYSGACSQNCSFTSGHAAMGYVFIALAWVRRRRQYFIAGCVLGSILGLVRMAQGAHFLSDVIFSFWAVYFVSLGIAKIFDLAVAPPGKERGSFWLSTALR